MHTLQEYEDEKKHEEAETRKKDEKTRTIQKYKQIRTFRLWKSRFWSKTRSGHFFDAWI